MHFAFALALACSTSKGAGDARGSVGSGGTTAPTDGAGGASSAGAADASVVGSGGSSALGGTTGVGRTGGVGESTGAGGQTDQGGSGASGSDGVRPGGAAADGAATDGGSDGAATGGASGGRSGSAGTETGDASAGGATGTGWQFDEAQCTSMTKPAFTQTKHPLPPTALWASGIASPRPTNSFWMNLVLNQGALRINLLPYNARALADGLGVSVPSSTVADTSITTADRTDVDLSVRESVSKHEVTAYDDLSVTLTWTAGSGTLATPLVYGMPYATGLYQGLTPSIKLPSASITSVNGATAPSITGRKLVLALDNGQTWNLYASQSLAWTWSAAELHASQPFTGSVRLALVPDTSAAPVLDNYATAIPTSGSVALAQSGSNGLVRFDWSTQGPGTLLMMALPHHVPRLGAAKTEALSHATVRGAMTAVTGASWTLTYPLSSITWTAPRPPQSAQVADIQDALQQESSYTPAATDPYTAGKELSRLARLELIARELGAASLADAFLDKLRTAVSSWLDGSNAQPLVYDTTWGGVVSAAGLKDSGVDYGNGYYNDHHFHYGYLAYAAAVVAHEDSVWASKYRDNTLWLVRDIGNPCQTDPFFPRFRHMDWYEGHSWASGLFEFGDNRNQESSSEAVNAWYGVELLGRALGNDTYAHVGAILRAAEIASAQTYWQVPNASTIYPSPFRDHHAVGLVWSTKVDFGTWFGSNPEYIYGIQMLPFTPASEDLLSPAWITDAWSQMSAAAANAAEQSWQGFMYMAHAVIDRATATTEVRRLTGYDDGNSRANTLYWVATRR